MIRASRKAAGLSKCAHMVCLLIVCLLAVLLSARALALEFERVHVYKLGVGYYDPSAVCVLDIDQDGNLDVAVGCDGMSGTNITTYLGSGDGSFTLKQARAIAEGPNDIVVTDFNQDELPDIAMSAPSHSGVVTFMNIGNGFIGEPVYYTLGSSAQCIGVGDFDKDGDIDLAAAGGWPSHLVGVFINLGGGDFAAPTIYSVDGDPEAMVIDDFNGDALPDIILGCSEDTSGAVNSITVLRGFGTGVFRSPDVYSVEVNGELRSICSLDIHGDGDLDFAYVRSETDDICVYLKIGVGSYETSVCYPADNSPSKVIAEDFDNDGHVDLCVDGEVWPDGRLIVYPGRGDGTFDWGASVVSCWTSCVPSAMAAGDFNNDGYADLVSADYDCSNISIFLNRTPGGSCCIVAGDINDDGAFNITDAVFVVNHVFRDGAGPVCTATADCNGDGAFNITDAVYIVNHIFRDGSPPMCSDN